MRKHGLIKLYARFIGVKMTPANQGVMYGTVYFVFFRNPGKKPSGNN